MYKKKKILAIKVWTCIFLFFISLYSLFFIFCKIDPYGLLPPYYYLIFILPIIIGIYGLSIREKINAKKNSK